MTVDAPEVRVAGKIPIMLRSLAWAMENLGVEMVYYGGFGARPNSDALVADTRRPPCVNAAINILAAGHAVLACGAVRAQATAAKQEPLHAA